jgi:hypothetical protein
MTIPYLNQILLTLVVTTLTVLLAISGVHVIHILQELRESVKKVNKILDDGQTISSSVAKPISSLSGFITGLKGGMDILNIFMKKKSSK